jgi:hypothetical protein
MSQPSAAGSDGTTPAATASPLADLLLPERARLLHIGAPKTGTTALQNAFSRRRGLLREHGVNYPGAGLHHQRGTSYLIDRPAGAWGGGPPLQEWWDTLKAQLDEDQTHRQVVSFELICQAEFDHVQRIREEMGERTHAVMVLRNFGELLPSMWQQKVKMGSSTPYSTFMQEALADPSAVFLAHNEAFHRHDGRGLAERWATVLGPQNVTVIVLSKSTPSLLFDAFEGMLGLPSGFMAAVPSDGARANRSMSLAEVTFMRELNERLLTVDAPQQKRELVWHGAVERMIAMRSPERSEGRLAIPEWAAAPCQEAGRLLADNVRASGVRVVGDLDELSSPTATHSTDELELAASIPSDAALEALLGLFSAAIGQGANFKAPSRPQQSAAAAEPAPAQQAPKPARRSLRSVAGRLRRRLTPRPARDQGRS